MAVPQKGESMTDTMTPACNPATYDPEIEFSTFVSVTDATATRRRMTWSALAQSLETTAPEHGSKAELPLLSLCTFDHRRSNATVESVNGVIVDYDAGQASFDEAVSRLRKASVEAVVYTSP